MEREYVMYVCIWCHLVPVARDMKHPAKCGPTLHNYGLFYPNANGAVTLEK